MSQFDHESDDQSAAANALVRELRRGDRVEMLGGVVHLPAEFREVARLANKAGLDGYEVVDVEVGMDVEGMRGWMHAVEDHALKSITYRRLPS